MLHNSVVLMALLPKYYTGCLTFHVDGCAKYGKRRNRQAKGVVLLLYNKDNRVLLRFNVIFDTMNKFMLLNQLFLNIPTLLNAMELLLGVQKPFASWCVKPFKCPMTESLELDNGHDHALEAGVHLLFLFADQSIINIVTTTRKTRTGMTIFFCQLADL